MSEKMYIRLLRLYPSGFRKEYEPRHSNWFGTVSATREGS